MRKDKNEIPTAIARIKSYIALHIRDPITASDLAKIAGYSQYHMTRIFKEETGLSPFEYIRHERLTAAAHLLRDGKHKVLDIALDFVFDSHEGFTRAFTKGFGISPKKYASHPVPEGWLILRHYLNRSKYKTEVMNMDKTAVIFTQIVERPVRKLILKRGIKANEYYAYCEEVGCGDENMSAPWDILCSIKDALYEPVGMWLPENMRPKGTGIYAHGVEVAADYTGAVPEGFDVINLEPCKFLVFQGEPYDEESGPDAIGQCMDRIKKFNPEVYGYKYAPELAPKMQLAPMGWRGYIEMMPIVSINQ
ncbi:MAG: AraC family transcriptional regulator [Defluviitaleaceae bacterium]|nr:AraC family transcriptional regulator [Defluviitaleaceae bacterium]